LDLDIGHRVIKQTLIVIKQTLYDNMQSTPTIFERRHDMKRLVPTETILFWRSLVQIVPFGTAVIIPVVAFGVKTAADLAKEFVHPGKECCVGNMENCF
jgi:hypothetical protein